MSVDCDLFVVGGRSGGKRVAPCSFVGGLETMFAVSVDEKNGLPEILLRALGALTTEGRYELAQIERSNARAA